jgi:tetratricopeptide (TPR) repeat protein
MGKAIIQPKVLLFALLAALGFLIYSNTFDTPFVFDDHEFIEENLRIRSLSNFLDFSASRYMALLTFAINYRLGGLGVWGYHFVNILIHVVNAFLVFRLVELLCKTPVNGEKRLGTWPATVASFLFLAHPVQTQAVTYLCQRTASLATLFYLFSILMYVKARLAWEAAAPFDPGRHTRYPWVFYVLSVLAAVAAQKTKEISFTLPFVIALCEFTFFVDKTGVAKKTKYLIPFILTLAIIPLTIFFSKTAALGSNVTGTIDTLTREELAGLSRHDYLITQFRVIVTYWRLLIFPTGQNLDYDYPVCRSFFAPEVFASFVLLFCFFAAGLYMLLRYRCLRRIHGVLMGFGVIFFFVAMSVESSVIPIADVIFEHRLYLPSAGLAVTLATLLHRFCAKPRVLVVSSTFAAILVIALSVATYRRNFVWKDELTLWTDVIKKSPEKVRGYNNVGYGYIVQGRIDEAISYFTKVISLQPSFFGAYNNLGEALVLSHRNEEALKYFKKSIEIKPSYWKSHSNLGLALAELGRYAESVPCLEKAVSLQPVSADLYNNLGNALFLAGNLDEAIRQYKKALAIDPGHQNACVNLENAVNATAHKRK